MRLMIGTPAYGGQITLQYFGSVVRLLWEAQKRGLDIELRPTGNESLITRARNTIVHLFLKSDCTHLLFIDADIGFSPESVFEMLRLNKDVICGAYPKKNFNWDGIRDAALKGHGDLKGAAAEVVVNFIGPTVDVVDDCIEVLDSGTGFMMIKREVLVRMMEANPDLIYMSDHPGMLGEPQYALFDCVIDGGRYLSEDYTFCRRWQKMGGKIHVHLPTQLTHTGPYTFEGHITGSLEAPGGGSPVLA